MKSSRFSALICTKRTKIACAERYRNVILEGHSFFNEHFPAWLLLHFSLRWLSINEITCNALYEWNACAASSLFFWVSGWGFMTKQQRFFLNYWKMYFWGLDNWWTPALIAGAFFGKAQKSPRKWLKIGTWEFWGSLSRFMVWGIGKLLKSDFYLGIFEVT